MMAKVKSGYQTIADLRKELKRKNIPIPSWYKRQTLINLLQRAGGRDSENPGTHRSRTQQCAPSHVIHAHRTRGRGLGQSSSSITPRAPNDVSSATRPTETDLNVGPVPDSGFVDTYHVDGDRNRDDSTLTAVLTELATLKETVMMSLISRPAGLGDAMGAQSASVSHIRQGAAQSSSDSSIQQGAAQSSSQDMDRSQATTTTTTNNNTPFASLAVSPGYSLQTAIGPSLTSMPGIPGANLYPMQSSPSTQRTVTGLTGNHPCTIPYNAVGPYNSCNINSGTPNVNSISSSHATHSNQIVNVPGYALNHVTLGPSTPCHNVSNGVPSDSLPQIDIVTPSVRRDIIMGKDINLAALLIPGYKTDSGTDRHLIKEGEIIPLKSPSDTRLSRSLILSEFIMAFTTYKSIMCEAYPQRRAELDCYQRSVVEMAHKFGGNTFYDYHRAFSARAAAMLQSYNVKIDWSTKDTNLFCMTFAGHTTVSCNRCASKSHTSNMCPLIGDTPLANGRFTSKANSRFQDEKGRPRVRHDGREICNNFNGEAGCFRSGCNFLHACSLCKKQSHSALGCWMANKSPKSQTIQPQEPSQTLYKGTKVRPKTHTVTA